ncbi:MAG: bacteriohemerythrin [Bacteroidetes bacterium]|nr:bacteriohemerythrin [Bacteroidota bacterium]
MRFITWKDSFSVGVHSINDQHKKLVEMINNLYTEFYNGITNEFLKELIGDLEKYTVYHFSYEEKFMKLYGYNDIKEHVAEHNKFIEEIKRYKETVSKDNKTAVIDFATFLKNWLLKHIMGTDKKYSKLFQEKGMS